MIRPIPLGTAGQRLSRLRRYLDRVSAVTMSEQPYSGVVPNLGIESALRRVATLAAKGGEPDALFALIGDLAIPLLGVSFLSLVKMDASTGMLTTVSVSGEPPAGHVLPHLPLDKDPLARAVIDTGAAVRIDGSNPLRYQHAGSRAETRPADLVGAPIIVDGVPWGVIKGEGEAEVPLPSGSARRLGDFAEIMAIGLVNKRQRDELRDLIEMQSALRRVATLVAADADPQTVFAAVAIEASKILRVGAVSVVRYDARSGLFTKIFGTHGDRSAVPDGVSWPVDDCPEGALVLGSRLPGRIDDWTELPGDVAARHRDQGFGQAVAAPIIFDGDFWGHIAAFGEASDDLPLGCEEKLADFTQLMASAIANAQARDELRALAAEQGAALRRVATLVAQRAHQDTIFSAVASEASRAMRVDRVDVGRCDETGSVSLLGSTVPRAAGLPHEFSQAGLAVTAEILATGAAARLDQWRPPTPSDGATNKEETLETVVGAPIIVDDVLWGVIVLLATKRLSDDTEARLADFSHLVASSIAIVKTRNELMTSRARIVTASDEARRRTERNLHDGIQQRVVSLGLSLRAVRAREPLLDGVASSLDEVARDLETLVEEIQTFSQGLHPALLSRSGLGPSLRALAGRSPIPVRLDVLSTRLSEPVETAVYYVVSEAIANATKHSRASEVQVDVQSDVEVVRATVVDDGVGGAALDRGSGLIGLIDRVEALGGTMLVESPIGRGTRLSISLPLR